MKHIVGIMAATNDGIIGCNGALPWNYPDELEHFKNITLYQTVIMGQKTYQSIPKNFLKDRQALVLSRNTQLLLKDGTIFHNLNEFMKYIKTYRDNVKIFMIGGGKIANLFLENNLMSSFIFTRIHKFYPGDTYMNLSYFQDWPREDLKKTKNYTIYLLKNPQEVTWNL